VHAEKHTESNAAAFLHSLKLNSQRLLFENNATSCVLIFNERLYLFSDSALCQVLLSLFILSFPGALLGSTNTTSVFYESHLIEGANKRRRRRASLVFLFLLIVPEVRCPQWDTRSFILPSQRMELFFSMLLLILLPR
jgi:hypothetical protein